MKPINYFIMLSLIFFTSAGGAVAGVHLDKKVLTRECATCHYKANLKSGGGSQGCLVCHGNPSRKVDNRKMPRGAIPNIMNLKNIEGEFLKIYRHPTFDATGIHRSNEILPETNPKALRHADCVDCHHPHYVTKENRFAGIKGRRVANQIAGVSNEAEVCYRCHSESANLSGNHTNKKLEFSINNPSFHPVEGEGKNSTVISLISPYKEKKIVPSDISVLTCSSCHGNDNPEGPKGVHASRYKYILIDNYDAGDRINEGEQVYALCYRCHSRTSILGNESFRYHALHIQGKSSLLPGTSCFTCHNSHGSTEYKYLLKFNPSVVSHNSKGLLKFVERGTAKFSGECYLSCHGVDHNPKSY